MTWRLTTDANVHDSIDVPEPVTLVGVRVHVVVSLLDRPTVPVNPFNAVIVIVEAAAEPAFAVTEVGLAVIEKSGAAVKVTVEE